MTEITKTERRLEIQRLRRIMVGALLVLAGITAFGLYKDGTTFLYILGFVLFGLAFVYLLQYGGATVLRKLGYEDRRWATAEELALYIFSAVIFAALAIQKLT